MRLERVLVTGGSGFVGLNIVEALLSAGLAVTSFDCRAIPPAAREAFERLPGKLTVVEGDIGDLPRLMTLAHVVDAIIHGTAVTPSDADEVVATELAFSVNVGGSINALRAAARTRLRRMVFLSSASVYGAAGTANELLDEMVSPPAPRSVYAVSKFAAERLVERLAPHEGVSLQILRLGSVFGPWEHATGVRSTLSAIFQTTAIAASGAGTCVLPRPGRRDWIYSRDVAAAILSAVNADEAIPGPVNLGLGHVWTVAEWCDRLSQRFPGFSHRVAADGQGAIINFHGSIDRAPLAVERLRSEFGFEPHYGLDAAFADYMAWVAEQRDFLKD